MTQDKYAFDQQALDNLAIANRPTRRIPFDPKCLELAKVFLEDVDGAGDEDRNELAAEIQQTIEDFISAHNRSVENYMSRVGT